MNSCHGTMLTLKGTPAYMRRILNPKAQPHGIKFFYMQGENTVGQKVEGNGKVAIRWKKTNE